MTKTKPSGNPGYLNETPHKQWTSAEIEAIMDSVIDHFDFCKVHKVMTHLDWKWVHVDGGYSVPSVLRMKGAVRSLMRSALRYWKKEGRDGHVAASGGFQVRFEPADGDQEPSFLVSFCVAETYSDEVREEEEVKSTSDG